MTFIYILLGLVCIWGLTQLWALRSLTYINIQDMGLNYECWEKVKILDVRDASEYWSGHIPGTINISVGRLPVLWSKHIEQNDEVFILSRSWIQRNKAARILARRGFRQLYAVRGCYLSSNKGKLASTYPCMQ
ncbi:rhodanese-like domain-containing protein [Paenibacillus xylanexedens]|uniref:rhodanese-like domain-containing protein n=1 Tax=Paenibacillus xylanexedens TaxID=528191 RepID=UPI0011A32353|nr:rhodanese-like domain-containing protein [Paenibacillus xylanexedens]